jgi:anti-anti-sigma factor
MKVETQLHGMVAVVVPHGALVADESADFKRAVAEAVERKGGRVVIDLSEVPYLDSVGIESLLELYSGQPSAMGGPKLAALSETCREALDLTDVLARLDVFDTVENALRSYNR